MEAFESLAESIKSGEMTDQLVALLSHTAKTARTIPNIEEKERSIKTQPSVPKTLSYLKNTDSEKFELLMKFQA